MIDTRTGRLDVENCMGETEDKTARDHSLRSHERK